MLSSIDEFEFFRSPAWQALEKRLEGEDICPRKEDIFKAFDYCTLNNIKVVICGQDPYPNPDFATGVAFSIPKGKKPSPSLANVLSEYTADLHYPDPGHGDLTRWCKEGVLLWNAIPTCRQFKSLSHDRYLEWYYFNKELFEVLSANNVVFILCGVYAWHLEALTDQEESFVIKVCHPSPRANLHKKTTQAKFIGSRIFTRANAQLCAWGKNPVNWRL